MAEVEPGLPPVGLAASVSLVSLCDPVVAEWLSDRWSMVLPPSKWPEKVPKAIVHCTSEEWAKLCHLLFDRCVIRTMDLVDDSMLLANQSSLGPLLGKRRARFQILSVTLLV